jgi:O-Antigen ligase
VTADPAAGSSALGKAVDRRDAAKLLVPLVVAPATVAGAILAPGSVVLVVAVTLAILWLIASPGWPRRAFVGGLGALLIGYAFLGRGLAHAGAPPVYVGELVLGLGVLAVVFGRPVFRLDLVRLLLVGFMAWGLLQTVPYFGRYGVDALRDAVSWGYGFFAFAIAALVTGPDLLRAVDRYRSLIFPLCLFIVLTVPFGSSLPALPGSEIPLNGAKPGDTAVHLAGIAAFVLLGLYAAVPTRVSEVVVWLAWLPAAVLMGVITRGGLGAIAMSGLAVLFGHAPARLMTPLFVGLIGLVTVVHVDPVVDLGGNREISIGQVVENVTSVFTESDDPALEGTKEYRLRWWGEIYDYTIDGPYFWTGKGFGVNLADDDGFQVYADHSLRAPHNGHMDILARMGVPGLGLWVGLNLAWAVAVLAAVRRARAAGSRTWAAVLIWLLVYWAAMLVNASFDPYLQGPQGGIWYWSVIGAGIVAIDTVRRLPDVPTIARAPTTRPARPAHAA